MYGHSQAFTSQLRSKEKIGMFSNLHRVTAEMAGCNGFSIKPIEQWPNLQPEFDLAELDSQASRLSGDELSMFVDGEESEVSKVTSALKLDQLNDFLNEVFDGYLHEQISI